MASWALVQIRVLFYRVCSMRCIWRSGVQLVDFHPRSFKSMRRRNFLLFALWSCSALRSEAQNAWPVRVSRFIVPFSPGGALDTPARMIAQRLSTVLGATFVVENRAGAGGAIGAQAVVQAPPDGSTLLFTSSSISILPALQPKLGLDPRNGLLPVSLVCDLASALLVRANSR